MAQEGSLAHEFERYLLTKGLADKTIKNYLHHFKYYASKYGIPNQKNFDNFLVDAKYLPSAKAFLNNLKSFLMREFPDAEAHKLEIMKRTGRVKRRLPEIVTEEEVVKLEEYFPEERERLMTLFCFYSGLRLQGMINISLSKFAWDDWHLDETKTCKLKVVEKGNKERIVPVPAFLMHRFRKWVKSERSFYLIKENFDKPIWEIGKRSFQMKIRKAGKVALGKNIHPHTLRHGAATWLLQNDWSLQEIKEYLGHESIATTEIYAHIDKRKLTDKYDEMFN